MRRRIAKGLMVVLHDPMRLYRGNSVCVAFRSEAVVP